MNITWLFFKTEYLALAGVAQWIECWPENQGLPVQFPVKAHAWIVGQVSSGGAQEATTHYASLSLSPFLHLSLSLSFSLPSPLSKSKNQNI